jgi:hypothetical protein
MRLAGTLILAVGWLAALLIYGMAARHAAADAGQAATIAAAFDSSEREMQQVERLGGTAAVLTLKFHRWIVSLWHGERLACTLAALAAAAALLCWHIAGLMAEDVAERPLAPGRK